MTFSNHTIWLMYKYKAYRNTKKALNTLGDLAAHCAPVDDICHKRWEFLKSYLPKGAMLSLSMSLEDFYQEPMVLKLLSHIEFLENGKNKNSTDTITQ